VSSVDHVRLEKFKVSNVSVFALKLDTLADFCKLLGDPRGVLITVSVN
jgi:hypothetical protein